MGLSIIHFDGGIVLCFRAILLIYIPRNPLEPSIHRIGAFLCAVSGRGKKNCGERRGTGRVP